MLAAALLVLGAAAGAEPRRQTPPELAIQTGHWLSVDAVAQSRDGRIIATAGKDGQAILWDAASGRMLRAFHADALGVTAVALSADGRNLLTGGAGTAVLWDSLTGKALRRFGDPGEFLAAVALSPDGRAALTAGGDGGARLWDLATGKRLRQFSTQAPKLTGAALSRDGRLLALTAGTDRVWVFDAASGALRHELNGGGPWLRAAFSPNGGLLAAGAEESARLWDLTRGGQERAQFKAAAARAVAFSGDGRSLLTCGAGNTARLWTLEGEPVRAFIGHLDSVRAAEVSADGLKVLTGSDDHSARLWDLATGLETRRYSGAPARLLHAQVSADSKRLVTIDAQGARTWEVESGRLLRLSTGDFSASAGFSLSRDGRLLASIRDREMVDLKDLESGQDLGTFQWNLLRAGALALDPGGRFLATANDAKIQLWDIPANRERPGAPQPKMRVNRLWVGLSGRRLLYLDAFGELHLWDLEASRSISDWPSRGASLPDVAVSPDGLVFACADRSGKRVVWSIRSLEDGRLLKGWDAAPGAAPLAFGPGNQSLLLADGASAWDFDPASGRTSRALELPSGVRLIWPQAVDPSWRFALGEADGTAAVLSLTTGRELGRLSLSERGWLVTSREGKLDASPDAARWTVGLESFPVERFAGDALERGLLGRLLSGEAAGR